MQKIQEMDLGVSRKEGFQRPAGATKDIEITLAARDGEEEIYPMLVAPPKE